MVVVEFVGDTQGVVPTNSNQSIQAQTLVAGQQFFDIVRVLVRVGTGGTQNGTTLPENVGGILDSQWCANPFNRATPATLRRGAVARDEPVWPPRGGVCRGP